MQDDVRSADLAGTDAMTAPTSTPMQADSNRRPAASAAVERARTVPYGALAEERTRRKELQRELQESLDVRQRLQERLDALHQLAVQQAPATSDTESEPAQAFPAADAAENASVVADSPDAIGDDAFRTQVLQSVRSYARERPDFLAAYQHARNARIAELSMVGYAPEEALAITFDNELEVIRNAYATGRNPARVIYDYAVQRGYRAGVPDGESSGGGQAPLQRPVTGAMSEADKVALAARGQAGAKSLSSAGGGTAGTLTLDTLASLSDEEFAEATKGDRWQRLLRG